MRSLALEVGAASSRGRALAQGLSRLRVGSWIALDAIAAGASSLAGHWLSPVYLASPLAPATLAVAASYAITFVASAYAIGLYDFKSSPRNRSIAAQALTAALAGAFVVLAVTYGIFYRPVGRIVTAYSVALTSACVFVSRALALVVRRAYPRRILLAGESSLLPVIRERLEAELPGLFEVVSGAVPAGEEETVSPNTRSGVDEIVLAEGADPRSALRSLPHGCVVRSEIDFYEDVFERVPVAHVSPSRLLAGGLAPPNRLADLLLRIADVAFAIAVIVLALPVAAAAGVAIAIEGGGPILYSQVRVGRYGRRFRVFKFRTMTPDAESAGPSWAAAADPRRTRVGRWLRAARIDELPQLWNVLRGEMSFVGPRPERPEFVGELESKIPHYSWRHLVRPGITGWAQIHLPYAASVEEASRKLEFDLFYVRRRSLGMNLAILLRTAASWTRGAR